MEHEHRCPGCGEATSYLICLPCVHAGVRLADPYGTFPPATATTTTNERKAA